MKNIQSKQLAPIPSAAEFDRLMANVGLTVSGLTSGSGGSGSGGGTTVVNNYNTTEVTNNIVFSDCMVRLLFSSPLEEETQVYSYDPACVRYVAFDGHVEEQIGEQILAPVGTTCVDFIFNDRSFPIPNAKIPDLAFKSLVLDTVIVPSGIMLLGEDVFSKGSVRTLIMQSVTPPVSLSELTDKEISTLVVPDAALDAYQKAFGSLRIIPMTAYVSNLIP